MKNQVEYYIDDKGIKFENNWNPNITGGFMKKGKLTAVVPVRDGSQKVKDYN